RAEWRTAPATGTGRIRRNSRSTLTTWSRRSTTRWASTAGRSIATRWTGRDSWSSTAGRCWGCSEKLLPVHLLRPVAYPRHLGDQLIQRGERDGRVGREARRGVGGERCQRGVADQEHVEVARQVLVAGRRAGVTHVGAVAHQQDVPDPVLLQEVAQRR